MVLIITILLSCTKASQNIITDNNNSKNNSVLSDTIQELPSDLPIILGRWENINWDSEIFEFSPNHDYVNGLKASSIGLWGKWELNEDIITIYDLEKGDTSNAYYGEWAVINETATIKLVIIDQNNIILYLPNEYKTFLNLYDENIVELRRNNDLW